MMDLLLRRSGYRLRQRRAEAYNDDVEAMVTAVVEHRLDFEGLVDWFKKRIVPLPKP
jgi:prophage maintenance system killer protein